jgi:hypothetical protein
VSLIGFCGLFRGLKLSFVAVTVSLDTSTFPRVAFATKHSQEVSWEALSVELKLSLYCLLFNLPFNLQFNLPPTFYSKFCLATIQLKLLLPLKAHANPTRSSF